MYALLLFKNILCGHHGRSLGSRGVKEGENISIVSRILPSLGIGLSGQHGLQDSGTFHSLGTLYG
jgi:hypothetical protein